MPVRPENKGRYPPDWPKIRQRILERADNRCERCGVPNGARIVRRKDDPEMWEIEADLLLAEGYEPEWDAYRDPVMVVLTIGHLNHMPEDNRPENLLAMCQFHHLAYDIDEHKHNRRLNCERKRGQTRLPLENA